MIESDDLKKFELCSKLMDDGKYHDALLQAESILNPGYRASILIDAGYALNKPGKIRQGIVLFEELLTSETGREFAKHSLLYNIANGYSSIYSLRRQRRNKTVPPNDIDLRSSKRLYRESLEKLPTRKGEFASQVYVNYGNCLSQLGRFAEAIQSYQKGLNADPTNGMAAGNLAIELKHAVTIVGRYKHEYLALAHELLTRALGNSMHLKFGSYQAIQSFRAHQEQLTQFLQAHRKPIPIPEPVMAVGKSKAKKEYVQFCIENGLFLNAWVGDPLLSPGITDEISYGPIVTSVDDNSFVPELLRLLNEIKEAFAAARYLYFLSQQKDNLLDEISGITLYFDNLDYDINGIYTGLCKTAYVRAFDILDKVARIVNVYFGIGNRRDYFWTLFASKQSRGEEHVEWFAARPTIANSGNYGLFALADICIDYFEQEHVDLATIDDRRNKITHDHLTVRLFHMKNDAGDAVSIDEISKQTLNVLLLAKHAVLYAVSAVNLAEAKKASSGKIGQLIYGSNPGQPFM